MMTINHVSLPRFCEASSGGIRKIAAIETKDILVFREPHYYPPSLPMVPYSMAIGDITLKGGANVYEWLQGPNQSAQHFEVQETGPHGPSFGQSINFNYTRIADTYVYWISQLRDKDFILIYQTLNKTVRVVGTPEQPMKFLTQRASGSRPTEKQQMVFSWLGTTLKPAPFLPSYDLAVLFPGQAALITNTIDFTFV